MKIMRLIVAVLATILALITACNQNDGKKAMASPNEQTVTYGAGRFVIDIPLSMQYRGGSFHARYCELEEIVWPDTDSIHHAEAIWQERLEEIKHINPPKGKDHVIIDIIDFPSVGKWCKGVFYYKEPKDPKRGYIDLLLDSGPTGLWIRFSADAQEKAKIIAFVTKIAKAYRPPAQRLGKATVLKNVDSFYLEYGAIDLPFKYKESADIGFKGHRLDKDLELSVETRVIHKEKKAGLLERAAASIASNYAPGVKLEKIRSGKRTVAGLEGEELIEIAREDDEESLSFAWMYLGKVDSGHYPNVVISMDSGAKEREQKIASWDSILNSMRPAGR